METSNWISLGALLVAIIALWRAFRAEAKVDAEKSPILKVFSNKPRELTISLRSMQTVGYTASRVTVIWPPGGKIRAMPKPNEPQSEWSRSVEPRLFVKPAGTKGHVAMMGTSDEHQVSLLFWPSGRFWWFASLPARTLSRIITRSAHISSLMIVLITLKDERDKTSRHARRTRIAIP